ncbi:MAG: M23 family metallopeptidase [Caldilineaceae bacterium]
MNQTNTSGLFGAEIPAVGTTLEDVKGKVDALLSDHVAVVRMASHLSVLMIAGALLVFSQLELPKLDISLSSLSNNITGATLAQAEPTSTSTTSTLALIQTDSQSGSVFDIALPRMVVPLIQKAQPQVAAAAAPQVVQIRTYTVQPGDTIFGIAQRLGLNPESLQWANPTLENNPDLLNIGDQLKIPPSDGVVHTVHSGDTLNAIAQRYKVSMDAIVGFMGNGLKDAGSPLVLNQDIFVPGGVKPFQAPAQVAVVSRASAQTPYNALKGSGSFGWPATGQITQYYWRGHPAIDVASWVGNPVKSADDGYVVEVVGGWSSGYGLHVIIDHGNGFQTLYAHLSSVWVSVGENVSKGQQIGAVGSTGNSTGPHLHFEVRYQGVGQNPLSYLR